MEQPYSIVADWLSKFHTWPELIQALWLVTVPVTLLGLTWLVLRSLTEILSITSRRSRRGHLLYGVYRDAHGRWMVYRHDREPQAIDWSNPPELLGRGQLIPGGFRHPEE